MWSIRGVYITHTCFHDVYEYSIMRKPPLWFLTRSNTNWAVQPQRWLEAGDLLFRKLDSEIKGNFTDKDKGSYHAALQSPHS